MSNYVSGLVFKNAPYEDDRFHILVALADAVDDDGRSVYPMSLIKLARKARVSYRNTIKSLQELEKEKIAVDGTNYTMLGIGRFRMKGKSNHYRINVPLLESLPFYWPAALTKITVQQLHRKKQREAVEKTEAYSANVQCAQCTVYIMS
jgi:hypothetical protein